MSKRRALVLILLHVAILIHLIHWRIAGATVSPLEPSEAMYTLRDGILNAGAILLVLSILSTLVLGRFFCGWGCHVVALQDLCAWMLKKAGIHPRPLRSRWLVFVPLLAGLYMFFWPRLMAWANGFASPGLHNGMIKVEFWETFPGFWIGALTFFVCGFVIVYLLGAKGFCTYACPYGGLFGVVDRFATGRIRVTDACRQCGHCTAVCTSNVLVSKEVLEYGMVVDPGCMKCQDCVSVCPENALYFGFGKPAIFAKPRRKVKKGPAPQFSWREELAMLAIFAATLVVFRGLANVQIRDQVYFTWAESLYGQVPLLFALGLSAITAFLFVFAWRTLRRPAAEFLGRPMKAGGRLTGAGKILLCVAGAWLVFLIHSSVVQYHVFQGLRLLERDERTKQIVWWQDKAALAQVPATTRDRWKAGEDHLLVADRIGLVGDPRISRERSWLAMAGGDLDEAAARLQEAIRRRPDAVNSYRELGHVSLLRGDPARAIPALREALRIRPIDTDARNILVSAYVQAHDYKSAVAEQRIIIQSDKSPPARARLASLMIDGGDVDGGIAELKALVADHETLAQAHALLGLALQHAGRMDEAGPHLRRAEELAPGIFDKP